MRYDSLKQLYDVVDKKINNYNIVLNDNNLIIENTFKHFIKIIFNHGFFDVYIDDIFYHDIDKFDIEEAIESIINNYILFKDNTTHILSLEEFKKVIKKDPKAQILKF